MAALTTPDLERPPLYEPLRCQPFYRQRTALATRNLSEGQRKLHFHKGRNTILFKLYNGVNLMFYSVVLSK